MRYRQAFIPTLKEVPSDAQVKSHIFMVRGGYIRQLASGIYNFLPLGIRVVQKIEKIVREEMQRSGAQEVLMPASIPAELWQESGRWEQYGPELLRFQDRRKGQFCFGPTHEEVVVDMVRREVKSYRELPQNLFQIQGKFRDELRPRAGLMRGREFIMKDAYSFDTSEEAANTSYDSMYAAYQRIFSRCGLDFRVVEADTGAIGGSRSHEFQVLAETGEDAIVSCDSCDYAANVEQAELRTPKEPGVSGGGELAEVHTPGKGGIEDVVTHLGITAAQMIKCVVYMADGKPLVVLVRGDRGVNEIALKKHIGCRELFMAREKQVLEATGAPVGYVGPQGLSIPIYADEELRGSTGGVTGANKKDHHVTGFDIERDANVTDFVALRMAQAGDNCARCEKGKYRAFRGIEVGHVFFLGTKYSEPMGCKFLDEGGTEKPMVMGCYGIGITRVAASAIEQNHDDGGICWPLSIAPYEVTVLPLQDDEEVNRAAETLYQELLAKNVDVLLDDRKERPGAKFKDADLIGIPLRVAIGKRSLKDGTAEVKWRTEKDVELLPIDGLTESIVAKLEEERRRLAGTGTK